MSERPTAEEHGAFYQNYIDLVKADSIGQALEKYTAPLLAFYTALPAAAADYRYGADKWTLKELLQHLLDTERIMSYRLLRIARNDQTPLAGFDENAYAAAAQVAHRSWEEILSEFKYLRQSTHCLFGSLAPADWQKRGTASGHPISVRALGFIILGHLLHHQNIILERYGQGPDMAGFLSLGWERKLV